MGQLKLDRFRYTRSDQFVYQFVVHEKPLSSQGNKKHLKAYKKRIREIANRSMESVINSDDVEIEITWSTVDRIGVRSDIDNIIKPIIDSLVGVAFDDDKQVRTVIATNFDKTKAPMINCYIEDYKDVFLSSKVNTILVTIYSDQKLNELGGEKVIKQKFLKQKVII